MLNGEKPSETATKTFDLALILHADHELNASTFAARVIAATLVGYSLRDTGAIGALKGPLHGGANEAVMRMLFAIDKEGADPVDYVAELLAQKKKISGFGHRVYHTEDPGRPTCGRCRKSWVSLQAMPSGSRCRERLRSTCWRRRS